MYFPRNTLCSAALHMDEWFWICLYLDTLSIDCFLQIFISVCLCSPFITQLSIIICTLWDLYLTGLPELPLVFLCFGLLPIVWIVTQRLTCKELSRVNKVSFFLKRIPQCLICPLALVKKDWLFEKSRMNELSKINNVMFKADYISARLVTVGVLIIIVNIGKRVLFKQYVVYNDSVCVNESSTMRQWNSQQ